MAIPILQDLSVTGEIAAASLDISGNVDIDGTTNLDAVDIDGAVQIDGTVAVGVDGTGKDVKFFGDTAGKFMHWDQSEDALLLTDATELLLGTGSDLRLQHDATDSIISSETGDFIIRNIADDKDMLLQSDDGSGGIATYITLDGSATKITMHQDTTFAGDIHLVSASPVIYFDDTSQTNDGAFISGSSSAASLALSADYGDNVHTTKIYFSSDGSEVGHFRGNSSQIGSFRLFPQKNDNTAQGIFFGEEASEPDVGDWTGYRAISFDSGGDLNLMPGSGTVGCIKIENGGTTPNKGDVTIAGDTTFDRNIKVTKSIERSITTASNSSNTHTCTLADNDNFNVAVANAATTLALVVASGDIGKSGMITITNPASVGSLSFVALPSYMLTPSGATINFVTTANAVSVISYYVLATDKVLCNYIGDFA